MPFRLIGTILIVVLVAVLTGFNLSNKCTIWCFHKFEDVPVFASILGAFIAGIIFTFPYAYMKGKSNQQKKDQKTAEKEQKQQEKEKQQMEKKEMKLLKKAKKEKPENTEKTEDENSNQESL